MPSSASSPSSNRDFNGASFLWRFVASMILVVATYNPTGFSYLHWLSNSMRDGRLGPEHFVGGILVIIGWVILLVAAQRSLGTWGMILGAALIGGFVWLLTDVGLLAVSSVPVLTWVSLLCLAVLLAIGLSWSHVWRRMTGQYEVDDD